MKQIHGCYFSNNHMPDQYVDQQQPSAPASTLGPALLQQGPSRFSKMHIS